MLANLAFENLVVRYLMFMAKILLAVLKAVRDDARLPELSKHEGDLEGRAIAFLNDKKRREGI